MDSVPRSSWLAVSLIAIALLAFGVVLPGCPQAAGPGRDEPPGPGGEASREPAEPGSKPERVGALPESEPLGPLPDLYDLPAGAPVSAFAPAGDLAGQVPAYIKSLEKCVAGEEDYEVYAEKISKDANALILIALALGLHDQGNQYKAAASGLVGAARDLAAAADFASARQAVEAIRQAADDRSGTAAGLGWERVASLPETMKKIPVVHTNLKKYVRRLDTRTEEARGEAAVLAVIAQGSMANAGDTDKPDEVEKWRQYCLQMRNAAAQVNAAIRARHGEAVGAAMARLQQSCDACHEVFAPEQLQAE